MKKLWQRHRTWFLAVLPGLAIAALLAWWFTPRPRLTVALPEIPEAMTGKIEYRYPDNDICIRSVGKKLSWVAVELASGLFLAWPSMSDEESIKALRFVNVETGEVMSHPGLPPLMKTPQTDLPESLRVLESVTTINPLWLDANGRFLVERRTYVGNNIRQIDWFDTETKESGSIAIPRSHDEPQPAATEADFNFPPRFQELGPGGPSSSLFGMSGTIVTPSLMSTAQGVSPDGREIFEVSQSMQNYLTVRIFDLQKQEWREQHLKLEDYSSIGKVGIHQSADRIAIQRLNSYFVDVYETRSGQKIGSNTWAMAESTGPWHTISSSHYELYSNQFLWASPSSAISPSQLTLDFDGGRTLHQSLTGQYGLSVQDESGTLWEDDADSTVSLLNLLTSEPTSDPQFTGSHDAILESNQGRCPGLLERYLEPIASRLNISLPFKTHIGTKMTWTNWQTNKRVEFRTESPDEKLSRTFAVRPDCVCLLVNPKGPNPRIEVWSTPPPQRPVLAIWLTSLAVTVATWFRLRHDQRIATTRAATAEAASG